MRTAPGAKRAVTSSPGRLSAKPRTSNPHATFDTVAGAKAVTDSIPALILTCRTKKTLHHRDTESHRKPWISCHPTIELTTVNAEAAKPAEHGAPDRFSGRREAAERNRSRPGHEPARSHNGPCLGRLRLRIPACRVGRPAEPPSAW